jgi:non-canonical poly(A) RNA polymerase PAPD5/7
LVSIISFNFSVNRNNGVDIYKILKEILDDHPFIRPLFLLLKYALRQNDLNETYKGGVSSFLLFNMIYAYIQYLCRENKFNNKNKDNSPNSSQSIQTCEDEVNQEFDYSYNLGTFLIGFLKFYGFEFNYLKLGISLRNKGHFFLKREKFPYNINNDNTLCIENFQEPNRDVGKSSHQFSKVRELFQNIYRKLLSVKDSHSYLNQFIIVTDELRDIHNSIFPE